MTKWDSRGSHSKMLYLSPSAFHLSTNIQTKTHSLEVSKQRNAALTTSILKDMKICRNLFLGVFLNRKQISPFPLLGNFTVLTKMSKTLIFLLFSKQYLVLGGITNQQRCTLKFNRKTNLHYASHAENNLFWKIQKCVEIPLNCHSYIINNLLHLFYWEIFQC